MVVDLRTRGPVGACGVRVAWSVEVGVSQLPTSWAGVPTYVCACTGSPCHALIASDPLYTQAVVPGGLHQG